MSSILDDCPIGMPAMEGHPLLRPPPNPFIRGVIEGFYGSPWTQSQRRELLRVLAREGLNTYVYAPKDDLKHRKQWKEKYGHEEAAELQTLIEYAKSLGIDFVYALSPGNDIEYSKVTDILAVKKKLEQLKSLGCDAFALLFDDIECKLSPADEAQYGTPANAQVNVANDCYTQLNSPSHFYFCPTEYCSTRAKPTLLESDYLRTIGDRLHPGIEIFWTGPLVVSGSVPEDNARAVAMVLKRKPLIWDNLYANDYDTKRVFLGPFKGRPLSLKKECAGILLNPNCQFELNIPAILSYSEWFKATDEIADVQASSMAEDIPQSSFSPTTSFDRIMAKWLKEIPTPFIPMRLRIMGGDLENGSMMSASESTTRMSMDEQKSVEEPMERSPSPESDISMAECSAGFATFLEGSSLTHSQLSALAHCCYLPFEYGPAALAILNGTLWLCRHASVMSTSNSNGAMSEQSDGDGKSREDWQERKKQVDEYIELIGGAFRVISANKVHNPDLAQYASDIYGILIVVSAALEWLKQGHLNVLTEPRERRWSSPVFGEPWSVCNSFVDDIAYALLPPTAPYRLIFGHRDKDIMSAMLALRAMRKEDVFSLSALFESMPSGFVTSSVHSYYSTFLEWSQKHCFVAEETATLTKAVVGTACCIPNIMDYYEHHATVEAKRMISDGDDNIGFPAFLPPLPRSPAINHYQSFVDLRLKEPIDFHVAKRLIQAVAVVMAYQGVTSIYTSCYLEERRKVEILLSLSFVELNSNHNDQILLGLRLITPEVSWSEEEEEEEKLDEANKLTKAQADNVEERGDKDDI